MIPFVVGYYRRSVHEWLGNRWLIILVLMVIIADLLIANEAMQLAIWLKLLLTLLSGGLLLGFYHRFHIKELV